MSDTQIKAALIDWGTSRFRLWLLDENGDTHLKARTEQGMKTLNGPKDYVAVLQGHFDKLNLPIQVPVVICGMAGSRQGLKEAPYIELPAALWKVIASCVSVDLDGRDVRILPGIAQRHTEHPDVIRGEETQLIGASSLVTDLHCICMPGTHSKWVKLDQQDVSEFLTFMTGEIFGLLANQSTLSHSLKASENKFDLVTFDKAVKSAIYYPEKVSSNLFSIRAGILLGTNDASQMRAKLSGLLIGLELAGVKDTLSAQLALVATGQLGDLYARALENLDVEVLHIDADDAVCEGLKTAANIVWPNS